MKYLLIFLLLLPSLSFAKYPVTYVVVVDTVYSSEGDSIIVRQEAVIISTKTDSEFYFSYDKSGEQNGR